MVEGSDEARDPNPQPIQFKPFYQTTLVGVVGAVTSCQVHI